MLTKIPKTALDIYRMLPEGTRCEVINNELTMLPSRNFIHQTVLMDISVQVHTFVKENALGKVVPGPIDLYFEDLLSAVQPDLLVALKDREGIIRYDGIYGAPDLIVEVISDNNRLHDTEKKKQLYEKAGVKEYVIIDPETKEVTLFTLNEIGFYTEEDSRKGEIKSRVLNFTFEF